MMSPDRIGYLEEQVTALRVANAELAVSVEHLSKTVESLTETVTELRDTMNKGRGALWLMIGASTLAGAGLAKVISKIFAGG